MKKFFLILAPVLLILSSWKNDKKKEREYYQLTVYHFNSATQEKALDTYFQNALLPALHRTGIKTVGVFKSWANDTIPDKLMYVFIPVHSLYMIIKLYEQLKKD